VLVLMEDAIDLDDVGGHEEAKSYLLSRVVAAMKRGETDVCPQNLALAGPPGGGKTILMKALGWRSKINMIFIDLALVKGRYVGDTERNWKKLWEGIVTFGPCIVVFDEADTKVDREGSSSADSGLFGAILENFGNPKYRGFICGVFITNVPRKLDAALLSRCVLIPILPTESIKVLTAVLRAAGYPVDPDLEWVQAAAATVDGWDGREVAKVVTEAVASVKLDRLSVEAALTDTLANWKPGSNADVQIMTDMALDMTSNLKLIPARYRRQRQSIDPARMEADTDKLLGRSRGRRDSSF
jgi:AAA+ superfamily predicted ATPase